MRILQIVLLGLTFGSGFVIFIWDWRLVQKVFYGQISSTYKILGISTLSGIWSSLFMISMFLLMGILDNTFNWTLTGIIGAIITAIALGVLVVCQ